MNCIKLSKLTGCCELVLTNLKRSRLYTTKVVKAASAERTMILVKPDGLQRRLVSRVLERFESRGYKLVGMKLIKPSEEFWRNHYSNISKKSFFPFILKYLQSGPVVTMVWQGQDVIRQGCAIIGETNPSSSGPGTVRGDFGIVVGRNLAHRSDSPESAEKEIAMWFNEDEIDDWDDPLFNVIYEAEED